MSEQSVIGVCESLSKAEVAIRKLDHEGFPIRRISIMGHNVEHEKEVRLCRCRGRGPGSAIR